MRFIRNNRNETTPFCPVSLFMMFARHCQSTLGLLDPLKYSLSSYGFFTLK